MNVRIISWKFGGHTFNGFYFTSQNMKLDAYFWNWFGQPGKLIVGTHALNNGNASPIKIGEARKTCIQYMCCTDSPLYLILPHSPSFNVGGSHGPVDNMAWSNIELGERGQRYTKRQANCANLFFLGCPSQILNIASVFRFYSITLQRNVELSSYFTQKHISDRAFR